MESLLKLNQCSNVVSSIFFQILYRECACAFMTNKYICIVGKRMFRIFEHDWGVIYIHKEEQGTKCQDMWYAACRV